MTEYAFAIQTPQGEIFKGPVSFVTASGHSGEVGILNNHAAMIIALKRGILKVKVLDEQKFFVHESGILEVKPNHDVLVLVDDALAVNTEQEAKTKLNAG